MQQSEGLSSYDSHTQDISSQRAHFGISITSPQNPAALAKVDDLGRVLLPASAIGSPGRV